MNQKNNVLDYVYNTVKWVIILIDLLKNSKETIGINDNITWPYIVYQFVLMFGTIIGPGTIFLMLVGASVVVFGISNYQAFFWNLVPIFFYVLTCMKAKPKWQLKRLACQKKIHTATQNVHEVWFRW